MKVFRSEKDELTDKTVAADAEFEPSANWIFYTDLSTPVGDLSGIDEEATEVLESRDVQTVEDLLALAPDAAAMRFEEAGLTSEDIRAWQRQALLSCRIPMLRREDAELLVLCGVHTPERLASSHPDFVFERVSAFLRTEDGRRFRRTSNPFDKQVAINWVRWSAHARTLWQSRERSSLERRSAGAGHYGEEGQRYGSQGESRSASEASRTDGQSGRGGDGTSTRGTGNGTAGGRDRTTSGPERRSALGSRLTEGGGNRSEDSRGTTTRELRARSRRRRRRGHDSDRSVRLTAGSREARIDTVSDSAESAAEEAELRFYLQRAEPVEAAPSIGPKTAERLAKVDIVTVEDLLEANPETAASRLKHRRIKADTLRAWQAQAMLVCRIPQMRGHDAQILVGCDVMTPEELAAMRPADLFARVMPFVDSSEGERIVRNGKKPDLAEVTFWIECARQARSLSAA